MKSQTFPACVLYALGSLIFGLAVLWDFASVKLWLSRIKNGAGPSAVPIVSWVIYFIWIVICRDVFGELWTGRRWPAILNLRNIRDLSLLTLFHLCCHGAIPGLYQRWLIW